MDEILRFYNLKEDPFRITPDPDFFYPTRIHEQAVESMRYLVEKGESFLLITGAPGTGKTTVIKAFLQGLEGVTPVVIYNPTVDPEELVGFLAAKVGLRRKGTGKLEVLERLKEVLIKKRQEGERFLLIVDEAQDMPDETLTEIKHLSNFETEKEKLLQIVLVGQPLLEDRLKDPKNVQLDQRISLRVRLRPLSRPEVEDFVLYRVRKAGNASLTFDKGAVKLIWKASKGIPRLINLICSRALMVSYLHNSQKVKKGDVKAALRYLNL